MSKRIYLAIPVGKDLDPTAKARLINASTPAAARLHVTRSLYDIRAANTAEVAHHMTHGAKVEEAGDEGGTGNLPGTEPQS